MYTLEDLRNAFQAGHLRGKFDAHYNYHDAPLDEDEYIESIIEKEPQIEERIAVTYSLIKATVGWSEFCNVTGNNHYAIIDFGEFDPKDIFAITKEEYNKLWP